MRNSMGHSLNFRRHDDGLNFRRRRKKINLSTVKYVLIFALEVLVTIGFAYLFVICFGKQVECTNESMAPTYESGQVLLVNSTSYLIKKPQNGDIVAFKPKSNVNASYSVKRIIGCPGDTVQIKNGRIYLNGEVYKESLKADSIEIAGIAQSEISLAKDQYFLLGDNRNASEDSRYESIGLVSGEDILGKIWAKAPF